MRESIGAQQRGSRWSRRRLLLATGGGAAAAAALVACGGKAPKSASNAQSAAPGQGTAAIKRGGTLTTFGTNAPPDGMETQGVRGNAAPTQPYFAIIHSGLLRLKVGEQYKFTDRAMEGVIAEKWEQPDDQTFVFHLRPGVKFHDKPPVNGRAVNSADVKFTFERFFGSPFPYLNFYSSIASIDTPDAATAVFKMKAPDATLLTHLSMGFAWILAKEAGKPDAKGVGGLSFAEPSAAIGTGPFMLDQYAAESKLTFVRNPQHWETGLPYLDHIESQILVDPAPQAAALQTGQAMLGTLPTDSAQDFATANPKLHYAREAGISNWHISLRTDQPPFSDVRVRRALAMTWDQNEIKKIWGIPADSPSSYGSLMSVAGPAYLPLDQLGDAAQWWKPNLNDAKQLLAAAGYPNGFTADYNDDTTIAHTTVGEQLVSNLAKIGVKLTIKRLTHAAFSATTGRGDYSGIGVSQIQLYDPDDFFSADLLPGTARNVSHVNDPMVTDLVTKQRTELDTTKRLDLMHQLVKYLAGQVYVLTYPQLYATTATQPYVKNYGGRLGYQPSLMVTWLDR